MHENYTYENITFQVEDIDTQTGKVWLMLNEDKKPAKSMVFGINDSIDFNALSLMVTGIYSGGSADLVCLRVNSSSTDA